MSKIQTVSFHGDDLQAIAQDGKVWVPIKRMCECLGMMAKDQVRRLRDKPWAVARMMGATGTDGKYYAMFCLDLDSVPMWLATIDTKRVKADARPRVELYQREVAQVLRDYFCRPSQPSLPVATPALPDAEYFARALLAEIDKVKALTADTARLAERVSEAKSEAAAHRAEAWDARAQLKHVEPKVALADEFLRTENNLTVGKVAKSLGRTGAWLFKDLRDRGWLVRVSDGGKYVNLPSATLIRKGWMVVVTSVFQDSTGKRRSNAQPQFTPAGADAVTRLYSQTLLEL